MTGTARYMYAITRSLPPGQLSGTVGIDGGSLETVEHRGLVAVVSEVDLAEYDEEALHQNLERMDWLEKVARSHDEVIQAVAAVAPVAPLRLATICLDDDGVRARLDEWHDGLKQALDRVEGCREWSVKVIAPPVESTKPVAKPASGADYLRSKKENARAHAVAEQTLVNTGEEVHAALTEGLVDGIGGVVVASRRLSPQDPRLSGHRGTMLLNGAYLVETSAADAFEEAVSALAGDHPEVIVECGGPWPPYSFATLEET
ncbi:MAG: GvpL/GvpF family gas vesicle protein [Pseudonocardiaceae bacterium]